MSFSLPETLMRGGEMQKMPLARRRLWALTVPTVIAAEKKKKFQMDRVQ